MNKLVRYFINGLVFIVPVALTFYIVYLLFIKIDSLLQIPLPGIGVIPGVGFVATLLIITLIGMLISNFLTKKIFEMMEKIINRLPLIKLLYSSIKDLIKAFLGDKKTFNKPVRVKLFATSNTYALGFITCESLEHLGLKDYVAVYFPQSYNFAGNLLLFSKDQVEPVDVSSSEVMTFIVSGGVAKG